MEQQTGCKILIRGRGSQKEDALPQFDDNEDLHVLVIGDSNAQCLKACRSIEKIIFSDEETRNKIQNEQLKLVNHMKNTFITHSGISTNLWETTNHGPPPEGARVIRVPSECVGMIIGKRADNIKQLQHSSGANSVLMASENIPNTNLRNIYVDSSETSFFRVI